MAFYQELKDLKRKEGRGKKIKRKMKENAMLKKSEGKKRVLVCFNLGTCALTTAPLQIFLGFFFCCFFV